uniref:Putative secreted protein n=1 Tax=Anopheles darlingi TaxID=43151 RepID=A0A2M4DJA7_ANODA
MTIEHRFRRARTFVFLESLFAFLLRWLIAWMYICMCRLRVARFLSAYQKALTIPVGWLSRWSVGPLISDADEMLSSFRFREKENELTDHAHHLLNPRHRYLRVRGDRLTNSNCNAPCDRTNGSNLHVHKIARTENCSNSGVGRERERVRKEFQWSFCVS